ncbi:hypothetical protein L6452_37556 [Arctium lappa]|uniref:Uncharacterized protein n=1 Tax=Arctium lappa TaxID=4217 RepID=A0ACB8Y7H0_ARCLA|nr:hypothetical protein L6452_37556 [Arctium lappa]
MVRIMVPTTITHQRLVSYLREKCGMDTIVGTTRIIYVNSGQMIQLRDNAEVSCFLQSAMAFSTPPTLYVYDDYTMAGSSNVGSNTGGAPDMYAEQNQTSYGGGALGPQWRRCARSAMADLQYSPARFP